jgi:2-hydroxychromene-2-carboxylate isomerase
MSGLKHITFYLDFISPYAYLAFERLPRALEGLSYSVDYQPVLFAGILQHHGQLGPAEIEGKRDWTYRQVQWLAGQQATPLDMPAAHPFNPLALLRLALACGEQGKVNRYVCETIFRHVWLGGQDAADAARLATLRAQLAPAQDPGSDEVKAQLKTVPVMRVDDKVFWGLDALPMLRDYLLGGAWFAAGHWDAAGKVPVGLARPASAPRSA